MGDGSNEDKKLEVILSIHIMMNGNKHLSENGLTCIKMKDEDVFKGVLSDRRRKVRLDYGYFEHTTGKITYADKEGLLP